MYPGEPLKTNSLASPTSHRWFHLMSRRYPVIVAGVFALCLGFSTEEGRAQNADSVEFFENRIRPVLVQHCYECHSGESDEIGGSFVLDSQSGMMHGGDSGPAIVPGKANESLLVSALKYDSMEMPPDGKLSDRVISDFEKWIEAGAVDPRKGPMASIQSHRIDVEQGRRFWAFQPRVDAKAKPTDSRSGGSIDDYLQDRLSELGIEPNQPALPETRLRRLAFDLTGLPPDQETLAGWIADPTSQNWSRVVDQMLASKEFAEHWARHWMDVARYADSNGSDFNATYHEAWRYRDYLVRSFAMDRPFDQMIRQQIAGDLLEAANESERHDNVVATTFLMLAPKMLSERDKSKLVMDVVDDQIDMVGRAFMGLTLGCARCHDHKFDPVPQEDYYALAGIFKSTRTLNGESQKYVSTWNRVKLPVSSELRDAWSKHNAKMKSLQDDLAKLDKQARQFQKEATQNLAGVVVDDSQATKVGSWKSSRLFKLFVGEGYVHDDNKAKGEKSIRFATRLSKAGKYEVRIAYSANSSRAANVPVAIETGSKVHNVRLNQRTADIDEIWRSVGTFEFDANADVAVTLSNTGTHGYVIADAVQFIPGGAVDENGSEKITPTAARHEKVLARVEELKKQIGTLKKNQPPKLPESMAPSDLPTDKMVDSPVHIRGEVRNLGEIVPRGFLQVCSSPNRSAITSVKGSGRLELADWLTDPDHPLVARVFVNRVWMYLMGEGIVRTVDNFGQQGERPSHPELLDKLATDFVVHDWQLKRLVRQIVHSDAYQRSSDFHSDSAEADPENRLFWRMNRRRIPAEAIRDSMLTVSGDLDRRTRVEPMAGRGTLVSKNNGDSKAKFSGVAEPCRSIYLPTVRGYMPPLMTMLDVADPNLLVGKRPITNVPAQALVLINSSEINEWASATADNVMKSATGFETRLQNLFLWTLQRDPTSADRELATDFFGGDEESKEIWREYIAAIFASTEFRILD